MCGIYGTINKKVELDRVRKHLYHRGPDAQTTWSEDNVQLHHFRLSILDLAGGVQPMHRDDLVTIFNGELYNHLDVRRKYDLRCETNSDTETLLAAYEKLGPDCLRAFDGMFAIAIYDRKKKSLFLARDRAGKKPLYIYSKDGAYAFASELQALAKTIDLDPDVMRIDQFFKGAFIGADTPYMNVRELCGGEYALIDCNQGKIDYTSWWSIDNHYAKPSADSYDEAERKVKSYLTTAVKRRVESSDLEVGAFLSGGIDSGLVVAAASQVYDGLKTFTVSMPGAYDEADLAKLVADKYKTDHHVININFDNLKEDFYKIVTNYGEPFIDSSAIPSYYVSQAAKEYVTVVLNGDGADEIFAGYRRYVPANKVDFYKSGSGALWRVLERIMPIAHEKKSTYNYLYRLVSALGMKSPADTYWALTIDIFQNNKEAYVLDQSNDKFINEYVAKYSGWPSLHKQMALDFYVLLQGILLKKMDIATMAHSLEGRSPFLCKELLEYAPAINPSYKMRGTNTKHILRNIAKEWLPPDLFHQPKRGFEIPLKSWMNGELKGFINDYLNTSEPFVTQFIKKDFINDLIRDKVQVSAEKRAKMLYQLLVTEMWAKENKYI